MNLLIVEPRAHGHHFSLYLRSILREALARGWSVSVLTTTDAVNHPAMAMIRGEFGERVRFALMPVPAQWMSGRTVALLMNQAFYYWAMWRGYRRLARRRFDAVFLMDLDSVDKALALAGSPFGATALSGVFVHLKFHWPTLGIGAGGRSPKLGRWFFERLLRQVAVRSVCVIDESFERYRRLQAFAGSAKVVTVTEPAVAPPALPVAAARADLGLAAGAQVVLAYGAHTPRKGLHFLLTALAALPVNDLQLVIAGDMDGDVAHLLSGAVADQLRERGQLRVQAGFVSDTDERRLFSAADAVWLGYGAEFVGQSAILPLSAAYGVPVLAKRGGMIGALVQQHGNGLCFEPAEAEEVRSALLSLLHDTTAWAHRRACATRFAATRTMQAFAGAICDAIDANDATGGQFQHRVAPVPAGAPEDAGADQ